MGRKKKKVTSAKTSNGNNYNRKVKKNRVNIDLAVIVMFILTILSFILIYGEKGALGEILSPLFGGIIGIIKYVIPFSLLILTINVAKDDRKYLTSKIVQYVVLMSCVASTISIYNISKGLINIDLDFSDVIEMAYNYGVKNHGGGTVGVVIAYPLINLFGMFGAAIVSVGIVVIIGVFTLGLHPSEILIDILDQINAKREETEDELNARRELRQARRMQEKEDGQYDDQLQMSEFANNNGKAKKPQLFDNIDDDNININGLKLSNVASQETTEDHKEKGKIVQLFKGKAKGEKEEFDPNVVDANLYKDLAKQAEKAQEEMHQDVKQNNVNDGLFEVEKVEKEEKTRVNLNMAHTLTSPEDDNYVFPPTDLLGKGQKRSTKGQALALKEKAAQLQKTLHSFGVSAKVEDISTGPVITRYELKPAEGVRVNKISNLQDDIALALAAESIRIEAPIPGKQAVGIEIPNAEKEFVPLRDILESEEFENNKSKCTFALGKDVAGKVVLADIAKMPHVLIAGSTGSGKSVCINSIVTSIIYNAKPNEVKLIMVDPKVVELKVYNGIPHLLIPVVTDPRKAAGALAWAVQEMENRYALFAAKDVRDLKGYNAKVEKDDENGTLGKLPQIVIIIDELCDLMMVAAKEVEDSICRLAQKARACGMHLVVATQRPSVDVITGLIKANIPSRIAFAVSSQIDSRTILDQVGAEKLLGKGDMLYFPTGVSKPIRVQGCFVTDSEVETVVSFVKSNGVANYDEDILEEIEKSNKSEGQIEQEAEDEDDTDAFLQDAIELVIDAGTASTSFIQRKFKVGYARAGRIIDQMEARGIISGYEGSKPRQVLMTKERWAELNMAQPPQETVSNVSE